MFRYVLGIVVVVAALITVLWGYAYTGVLAAAALGFALVKYKDPIRKWVMQANENAQRGNP